MPYTTDQLWRSLSENEDVDVVMALFGLDVTNGFWYGAIVATLNRNNVEEPIDYEE